MPPTFGRYELLKRLAGGGMGEVWLARQRGIDGFEKLLVIKTLLPHLCEDEEFIAMFKDEARVTAQLIHPNICQVFEFDQVAGIYYMAMEYLRGEDLRRVWKACEAQGRPLRVPLVCRIVADAAAGLDFAHSLRDASGRPYQIVHRDISPQNLLVTFEGGVKLIDFGVAKAAGRSQHTRTGALKGKYSYMSPEQVAGAPVDNRSDIFALGVVFHELLTGRRLFKAETDVETLARVRACEVPAPSRVDPQLPPGLDAIVLRALSRDPADRFRTAQQMRLALEDWLIQERMSASSAHLAEFLKQVYADRLEREARFGPLLGERGYDGPSPGSTPDGRGATPASNSTWEPERRPARTAEPTAELVPPELDPSKWSTSSGAPPFRARSRVRIAASALGALSAAGAILVFVPRAQQKPAPPPPAAAAALVPPPPPVTQEKQLPKTRIVTLNSDPAGAEVYEGARLLGRCPKVWADATEGEHELTVQHDGYREEKQRVLVVRDGDEFNFKLTRLTPAHKSARSTPGLGIKAER